MLDKIQLNNKPLEISEEYLPCLISYSEKTGGTHFSISFISDLFLSGSKILFLTAYPMAMEVFRKQTAGSNLKITYLDSIKELAGNEDSDAIIIDSGNEELFMTTLESLDDIDERVIFLKNIEIFGDRIIRTCLGFDKVILSGNIDKCNLKDEILSKAHITTILFNQPETEIPFIVPKLGKYTGYLWSKDTEGVVNIKMS